MKFGGITWLRNYRLPALLHAFSWWTNIKHGNNTPITLFANTVQPKYDYNFTNPHKIQNSNAINCKPSVFMLQQLSYLTCKYTYHWPQISSTCLSYPINMMSEYNIQRVIFSPSSTTFQNCWSKHFLPVLSLHKHPVCVYIYIYIYI